MTAILDPGAAGASCIGLLLGTDYFARAEACLIETNGNCSARYTLIGSGDELLSAAAQLGFALGNVNSPNVRSNASPPK